MHVCQMYCIKSLSQYKKKECLHNYILSAAAMSCSYIGAPKCWLFIHAAMCKYFTVFIALDVWNCLGITEQFRYVGIKEARPGRIFLRLGVAYMSISQIQNWIFFFSHFSFSLSGLCSKRGKKPSKNSEVRIGCSLYLISRLPFKNTILNM